MPTMLTDNLWYSSRREKGPDGRLLPPTPTKRHGRGKRYRVRTPGLPSVLVAKKSDAERLDAERQTDLARGQYIDPKLGRETVAAAGVRYRDTQLYRGSTEELVERAFRLHINPTLGRMSIAQVRPSHIQSWVKGLDLAPSTVRVVYALLCGMFAAAVRDRAIASSPCVGVTLPELPHVEQTILTPSQVHSLAAGLPDRYGAMVYVGAGCGLRHGEAVGLEVAHIDFLRRELHVRQQLTSHAGRPPYLAPPKTKTSRRTVELPKVTADALARHLQVHPPRPVEIVDETDPRRVRTRMASLVFTNSADRPIYRANWSHTWAPVARSIGLPEKTGFHALRHYFASLLIFSGASVKTVQMSLGHSTPTITLNTYVGLWPEQIDRTRSLVDAALGTAPEEAAAR
jgi:integrase